MSRTGLVFATLVVILGGNAFGQGPFKTGQPVFGSGTTSTSFQSVPKELDASLFLVGTDACAQLNECLAAVAAITGSTGGGTCNAESLVGTQTCSSNPWAGITAVGLRLQLGGATSRRGRARADNQERSF